MSFLFFMVSVIAGTSIALNIAQYLLRKDEMRDRYRHYSTNYQLTE